ncbi:hypothetical protein K3495_g12625 [Podosphaera aphanis]|nr:hypothetical protein K3495_g12625 [Podosphaera aphanis]
MRAHISTYPPLGLVSELSDKMTFFTALLEVDRSHADDPWQISLWHSNNGDIKWNETPMVLLQTTSTHPIPFYSSKTEPQFVNLTFITSLSIDLKLIFTIKFRNKPEQPWKWVQEHQRMMDGVVIFKAPLTEKKYLIDLNSYFPMFSPDLSWKQWPAKNPGTLLWSIEIPIEPTKIEDPEIKIIKLGKPWGQNMISRWMAIVRTWSPWLAPRQGKNRFELDKEAIFCSFLSFGGEHLVLLPTSCVDYVMTIFTNGNDGDIYLRIFNHSKESKVSRLLVGLGNDFESANAVVMNHAISSVSNIQNQERRQQEKLVTIKQNKNARPQNWIDGFTFCTWNALGQNLTEEKILTAATKLAENKINVTNFVIDDNWQSTNCSGGNSFQRTLVEFEAARKEFPNGLKHTVSLIRTKLPSIQHVAVWHTIHGYWSGIAPGSKLAKKYKTVDLFRRKTDDEAITLDEKMTLISKEDVAKFYDEFYRFLSTCGITAVKTDAQFILETFTSPETHRDLIPAYLDAWIASTTRHFGSRAISCMSQTPQTIFYSQMSTNNPMLLARNSDDFFPEIEASHPWHIFCNAHNALFTQHLNVIPDWDMFQTLHKFSGFHAAARCMSGGPICMTDMPGQHDLKIINQITGQTPGGKTTIFRLSTAGKSLEPYTSFHDESLLIVGAYYDLIKPTTGIIGIFNITPRRNGKIFSTSMFPGIDNGHQYLIRAYKSGHISDPLNINKDVLIYTSIDASGYDILSAYPINKLSAKNNEIFIANLGLLDKMTGIAAITGCKIAKLETKRILIETSLKALGILGLFISSSTLDNILSREKFMITIFGKTIPGFTVKINQVNKCILEIDTFAAWKEMGLRSDNSDEIVIKCIFELSS